MPIVWIEPARGKTEPQERHAVAEGQDTGSARLRRDDPVEGDPQADASREIRIADPVEDAVAAVRAGVLEAADLLLSPDRTLWECMRHGILPPDASAYLLEARILLLRAGICESGQGCAHSRLSELSSRIALARGKLEKSLERVDTAGKCGDGVACTLKELGAPIVEVIGRLAALESLVREAGGSGGGATDCMDGVDAPTMPVVENDARTRSPRGRSPPAGSSVARTRAMAKIEIRCGEEGVGVYSCAENNAVANPPRSRPGKGEMLPEEGIPATRGGRRASVPQISEIPAVPLRQGSKAEDRPRGLPAWKTSELGFYSRPREASRKAEEGVEIRRSDVDVYLLVEDLNARGREYRRTGRHEEALSCFDRVLEIDPDHPVALTNRGIVLRQVGRLEEAEACFNRVLSRTPSSAAVWMQKSLLLIQLERFPEALQSLDRVLALEPDRGIVWRYRADVLQKLGKTSEAADSRERARLLDAGN
ncbi:MAG: tetratricopeptide repeat protein [Methanomicrobiales archaeon]|nr:tetratricopeptide repeat protein [Methanomicrobiales archaeon]MDI6875180.1 tetratricopeptide repeat protein [Methanomicrobiales archaeon]